MKPIGKYSTVHVEAKFLVPGNKLIMSTKGYVYTVKTIQAHHNGDYYVTMTRDMDGAPLDFFWRGTRMIEVFRNTL